MVSIQGKNFNPKWGLYNGALGTIIDLHFRVGSNPNCGDLPEYVSVEFREYCGPVWDKSRPKVSTENSVKNTFFLHCTKRLDLV